MITQHQKELILDACLSDITKETFTEEYFEQLLEKHNIYPDPIQRHQAAQNGVKLWSQMIIQVDDTHDILTNNAFMLGSIISNYSLKKLDVLRNKTLEYEIRYKILNILYEYDDISKILHNNHFDFGIRDSLNEIKTQLNILHKS